MTFSAKLSDGAAWEVDLYDRATATEGFYSIGDLSGGECILYVDHEQTGRGIELKSQL